MTMMGETVMGETLNFILFLRVLLTAIRNYIFDPFFLCGVVSGVLLIAFMHWWKTALAWYDVVTSNVLS